MNGIANMRWLVLVAAGTALAGVAYAQVPGLEKAPFPSGPLIRNAPKNSAWTVTVTGGGKSDADLSEENGSEEKKLPKKVISVTKTEPVRLVKTTVKGGASATLWCVGNFQVHNETGLREPVLFSSSAMGFSDFSRNDFPELGWISKENYQGIWAGDSRKYLVFSRKENFRFAEGKSSPGASVPKPADAAKEVETVVYIDLETRLPFLVLKGTDRHAFVFATSPPAQLSVPDEVRKLVSQEEVRLKRLSARPPTG